MAADPLTHSVLVRVEDADRHHRQAAGHGATIIQPPTDYPYGERQYTAEDLGGHRWTFSAIDRRRRSDVMGRHAGQPRVGRDARASARASPVAGDQVDRLAERHPASGFEAHPQTPLARGRIERFRVDRRT